MPQQSQACQRMLLCFDAIDSRDGTDVRGSLDDAYGPSGTCWTNRDTECACNDACMTALESVAESEDLPPCTLEGVEEPVCLPSGPSNPVLW